MLVHRLGPGAALLCVVALSACGSSDEISEARVLEAAGVEDGAVGGDPFCAVEAGLGTTDEIEAEEGSGNLITSKEGNVGVVVVPPFPDDCAETVLQGLNKLDKPEKD